MAISQDAHPHTALPMNKNYCQNLMRHNDHENFLANLLHPLKHTRSAHVAIRALNIELAQIRGMVSNEDLGRMRVQFFRDGVDHVLRTGAPVDGNNAPVLDLLAEAVHAFPNASFEHLHTLIDAREADLAYPAPNYTQDLERFAVDTQGTLIGVHASILSSKMEKSQLTTASEMAGRAVGLSILLRAAPAHAVSRLSYMPRRRADEIGVSQSDMLAGTGNACAVFEEVASQAIDCLETAEKHLQQVPHVARPAFWPLSMARIYLSRLKKARFNPFDDRLQRSLQQTYPLALQTRLLLRRLLRT